VTTRPRAPLTPPTTLFARHFDELAVGDSFATALRTIGSDDVFTFATLTGDWHPQHTDVEWAERSRFGGRIAHGMLVLSCALGGIPIDVEKVLLLRRIRDAVFKRPLYLGESIRLRGRIEALRPVDDEIGVVECSCRVLNQDDRTLVTARIDVVWRRAQPLNVVERDGKVVVLT
jgi:3-hydroxybutyryl-CoA dehydratase